MTGSTIGLSVDAQDNVWTIHRPNTVEDNFKAADIMVGDARGRGRRGAAGAPGRRAAPTTPIGKCCKVAPPVLVYDQAGDLVKSWGGPGQGYDWPDSNHGITVDHEGNVWLAGNGDKDTQILKFTNAGQVPASRSASTASTTAATTPRTSGSRRRLFDDAAANEIYVADGYGNRRVIVLDVGTGKYKRHWGAYGERPSDEHDAGLQPGRRHPSKQFNTVHCAIVSNDGLVYVCDRVNDRIQVFRKDGTFVKEAFIDHAHVPLRVGVGHDVLARSRSRPTSTPPTAWTRRSTSCCAARSRC